MSATPAGVLRVIATKARLALGLNHKTSAAAVKAPMYQMYKQPVSGYLMLTRYLSGTS